MDPKKRGTLFRWILFLLIATLSVTVYLSRNRSLFGDGNMSFSVQQGKAITLIELSEGENRVSISHSQGTWMVNGSDKVNKEAIGNLLDVLYRGEIKSPVSKELFDEVIKMENPPSTRVRVRGPSGVSKNFTIYRTGSNRHGNIVKSAIGGHAYIVSVKGYDANIGSFFNPDEAFWKPYVIFSTMPSEIVRAVITRYDSPDESFTITGSEDNGFLFSAGGKVVAVDQGKLNRYLSYFVFVPFSTIHKGPVRDNKKGREMGENLFSIELALVDGISVTANFSQIVIKGDSTTIIDSDNLFGQFKGSDWYFVARYYDIDPLLKKISYFLIGNN